jgi:hypothetical protein
MIKECSAERYDEMLSVLPPALWLANHWRAYHTQKVQGNRKVMPTYAAFFFAFRRYCEGDDMTIPEFRRFDINSLPQPKDFSP